MNFVQFLIAILSFQFLSFSPFVVDGPSMEPTLFDGDLFLIEQKRLNDSAVEQDVMEMSYERGDIVVFSFEDEPDYFYVKRIIGLPGETLRLREDGVYVVREVGEVKLMESYLESRSGLVPRTSAYRDNFQQVYTVPMDSYFVLGDNRSHSLDSRYFQDSFVAEAAIMGRYVTLLLGRDRSLQSPFHNGVVALTATTGEVLLDVEVADEPAEHQQGLMFRTALEDDQGMLFLFEDERPRSFWMKNTLIPLDMIFIDSNWRIVSIVEGAVPCDVDPCPTYPSELPAQYVLEVNAGLSGRWGLDIGSFITFSLSP